MTASTPAFQLPARDQRYIRWQVYAGLAAFLWGIWAGLAQALDRVLPDAGTLWHFYPMQKTYYQGLTAHGVLLAIVFTFAFTNGFLLLVAARSLGRAPRYLLNAAAFWLLVVGSVLSASQIVANRASVLYTMYPPLQASPLYYFGLVLVVVSTWATALNLLLMYRDWRRDHPGEKTPLQGYAVLATYAMWVIASVGIAVEVLFLLLPWSLGLVPKIDPQLARALFWFTGHPIVYFWLLPAYVSWYTMVPRQVGGKLLSDPITRLVFVLFLVFSIPTGLHHQYTDPGVGTGVKVLQLVMTMAIFFPSMITAFTMMAALETGGRSAGGRGWLEWIRHLPWGDPSVTAQVLAMIGFTLGGVTGLVNGSYNVNLVVHNTAWVPGHFHLTVGIAVALSFLGICYWLIPHLTGRGLMGRRLAVIQGWFWFVGVLIMSSGQFIAGVNGLPRRLSVSQMTYGADIPSWQIGHVLTAVGGTLMFVSGILFFVVIAWTLLRGARPIVVEMPVATDVLHAAGAGWHVLERWTLWIVVAILVAVLAWAPFFVPYVRNMVSPGYKPW